MERKDDDDGGGASSSLIYSEPTAQQHAANDNDNGKCNANSNEQVMELKPPAPDGDASIINEYEREIHRLERLNETLSANLATLTAVVLNDEDDEENKDDEIQRLSYSLSRRNSITMDELSNDHGPANTSSSSAISISSLSSLMRTTRHSSISNNDDNNNNNNNNSEIIVTEDQYLYKISKLQKLNTKLTNKLDDKRQFISRLLSNIKVAASKIAEVSKERDTWRTKFEDEATNNSSCSSSSGRSCGGQKEMIAVQNELTTLLQLFSTNKRKCEIDRHKLLNAYRYDNDDRNKRMERPEEIIQRVVQSLRIGDDVVMKEETNNTINEATTNASSVLVNDYDETTERKTDSTLLNENQHDSHQQQQQQQQRQHQTRQELHQHRQDKSVVDVNEHPLCQQIKSFDRKLLREVSVTTISKEVSRLENKKKDVEYNAIADDMVVESDELSPPSIVANDDDDKDKGDGLNLDGSNTASCATIHHDAEYYENIGDVKEELNAQEDEVCIDILPCREQQHRGGKADLNVRATTYCNEAADIPSDVMPPQDKLSCPGKAEDTIDDDTDTVEDLIVDYLSDDDQDDDDDDMYDAREAKGPVMNNDVADDKNVAEKSNENETDAIFCSSDEALHGQAIDNCAGKNIAKKNNENETDANLGSTEALLPLQNNFSGENASEDFAVTTTEVGKTNHDKNCTSPKELIATILEEQLMKNANEYLIETLEKIKEQNCLKNKDESIIYLPQQHVQQLSTKAVQNKDLLAHRLSRRQLFHRKGTLELCLDVAGNAFLSPGDRQVLVVSKDNDKYMVPRYKPPMLPPQPAKKGAPIFKKGQTTDNGYYIYTSSKGNEYAGNFKDGKRHGYGIAKYRNGEVYNGQWRRGNRHGQGVLHLANGEIFDGVWLVNKKNGLGVYYWTDGEVDISWYQDNNRVESLRWTKDRRRAYLLDLVSSKKEPISLVRSASIVKELEVKHELLRNHAQLV